MTNTGTERAVQASGDDERWFGLDWSVAFGVIGVPTVEPSEGPDPGLTPQEGL